MSVKKLAGETMWYGVSSIAARFISYALTPYLTIVFSKGDYGRMGAVYSAIPLLNVILTYGMETAYFRFIQRKDRSDAVNNTAAISLLVSTVLLSFILWNIQTPIAKLASLEKFPALIQLSIFIIALDALTAIPLARLRQEGRPRYYAFIRISSIIINIVVTVFFLSYCKTYLQENPNSFLRLIYRRDVNPVTYVLIANVFQSAFTLLLLSKWLLPKKWVFDFHLWKEMIVYALPMLLAGMGGMINETFDRLMLGWWLPDADDFADEQRGIYNACYKLAILITLFVQAFRMGAEPFFFKQAEGQNPQRIYARVMKFFVLTICVMFLVVILFLPVWKHFIAPKHWEGLKVVPILLLANMFLGIYYNLSVWYKVTSRTLAGVWITLAGTVVTIIINWIFIPHYSYMACAWATFLCYGSMMVLSYIWGQKHYHVPYATKKLLAYLGIVVILFFIHKGISLLLKSDLLSIVTGSILLVLYALFIVRIERKEFQKLPVVGRYIK
ncbi:MAG TPA: oligosaccharide flippase family protein [Chitinophagaceae bacterium]|nr:oligosaccharide flippase family protein [Chitinophagaceae bacterium]